MTGPASRPATLLVVRTQAGVAARRNRMASSVMARVSASTTGIAMKMIRLRGWCTASSSM